MVTAVKLPRMQSDDAQLLKACRQGDESAWESLIKRYQKLIYAIPRRAGLNDDEAADVFQEVFATLFTKLDSIEEPNRLHAWLVTTARRKTWRVICKAKNFEQFSGEDEDEERPDELSNIPDQAVLPDQALIELEEQHEIRTAVAALDDRCRKLIEFLFYRSTPPTYAEIAQELGVPEGSIGPTRARCLSKVLRLLEKP
ncbi:MAG TPA: sigma-70 family RNA polymerase sigma factor [Pyrinomonadaceae bacterium]|nr:sigma-70 family RNA polymerase sigma factor [Pyrinomonadaceae bacterium]